MTAYYNEIDPYCAQWLRNLIAAGHIAPGDVDERSIIDVSPDDLRGYRQCHFFAGIGVWSYALRLAQFADDRPVWSGSCPCQPFSAAGKGDEFADERHLWPAWFRLIGECRPDVIFGEQVASKDALAWLDHVCVDLEAAGYAVGAVDTCAAGFGAPHIRQRLYFVAESNRNGHDTTRGLEAVSIRDGSHNGLFERGCARSVVADANGRRFSERSERNGNTTRPEFAASRRYNAGGRGVMGDAIATNGFWRNADWLPCRDGKARAIKPGIFPLAHGIAARVGKLRAAGNCICAPQAAEFIAAYCDAINGC